jgi:HK97 family phage major capsid protein
MKFTKQLLWAAVLAVITLWVTPESGLSAAPEYVTSGSHSAPIFHWSWLGAVLAVGLVSLEDQLGSLKTEIKSWFDKAEEQQKEHGTLTTELKSKIDELQTQADGIEKKIAERHVIETPSKSLLDTLKENEDIANFLKKRSGSVAFKLDAKQTQQLWETKTTIDSAAVGAQTTGVLQIERIPGIVQEARQTLTIRDLLASRPTENQVIDFVKVNSPLTTASPQIETHTKKENAVTFTTVSEKVRTLATWIPASRQILDDFTELEGFLRTSLPYYVNLAEEQQLLTGSGSGEDLNGLITQGTNFNTALLPAGPGWNRIDIIGRAIQQIGIAKEISPTFIVLHPTDWWNIRLTKDTQGRYILGDPMGPVGRDQLFGLTPVITTTITSGTFLVGSGEAVAAEIRDRMGMTVEIATQHEDYFARNMVAIRAEKRLVLIVKRPGSFIDGTFNTSP